LLRVKQKEVDISVPGGCGNEQSDLVSGKMGREDGVKAHDMDVDIQCFFHDIISNRKSKMAIFGDALNDIVCNHTTFGVVRQIRTLEDLFGQHLDVQWLQTR
jgi:hypothetical protein